METREDSKKIKRLLEDRKTKINNCDKITRAICNLDTEKVPGTRLKALNKKENAGDWCEYSILFEIDKYKDTPEYLSHVFDCLRKIIKSYSTLDIESIGIDEVDCSYPDFYYVLIYILSYGGKESKEDKEDYFASGGGFCC